MRHRYLAKHQPKTHGFRCIARQNPTALIVGPYEVERFEKGLTNIYNQTLATFSAGKPRFNYMDGGKGGSIIDFKIVD